MSIKVYHNEKEVIKKVSKYSHYAFVHYLFTHSSNIRLLFCQKIIKDRKIISTKIENSIFSGDASTVKDSILDIVAVDDAGEYYNIEMQAYDITESEMNRFQIYTGILLRIQSEKGKGYETIYPVHQILINVGRPIENLNHFYHHFISYDVEHQINQPYSKSDLHIFQLAYLEEEEVTDDFHQIMYLFKNDCLYDTINIGDLAKEAINMHESYIDSEEYWIALRKELAEYRDNTRRREALKRAEAQGIEIGQKQGILIGEKHGIKIGKKLGTIKLLQNYLQVKFDKDMSEWLNSLDGQQLEIISDHIYIVDSIKELQALIK